MSRRLPVALLLLVVPLTIARPRSAGAQPPDAQSPVTLPPPPVAEDPEPTSAAVNLDVQLATAYVFRGWNVFQDTSQMDPHLLLAPGVSWAIGETGLSVGYWAAYQLTGPNIGANTDGALNAEQDLYVSYQYPLGHDMALGASLYAYLYPAADRQVAGASVPTFLDPMISFSASIGVDLAILVTYFAGLQDAPAISGASYLYVSPSVGRSFELADSVGLDLGLGYGLKVFKEGNEGRSNVHDVLLSAALPIAPGGGDAYVRPGLALAWTNIEDILDEESGALVEDKSWTDGFVVWGSVSVGMDL